METLKFFLVALTIGLISACDVEDQYPSTVVPYPIITLKGDAAVSIPVGTPYTDAGATFRGEIDGPETDIIAEDADQVDVNTPGLYMVTYTATSNNLTSVKQRPVAVTNVDPSWDLSGDYSRSGF